MPTYIAHRRTWLSHENRMVSEGEEFSTTFPPVNGKPMRLSDNVELIPESKGKKPKASGDSGSDADLV